MKSLDLQSLLLRFLLPFLPLFAAFSISRAQEPVDGDSPSERLRWFYEQRAYPNDTMKQGYLLSASAQDREFKAKRGYGSGVQALSWTPIGPAPGGLYSGRVPALAVHPGDGNTVYAGAADGGVWKTTNAGTSWIPLTDDQPSLASGSLAIDPVNPNIIYWGTGEPYSSTDSYGGIGMLKSVDGGATWSLIGLTNEKRITRIAVNPSNPDIVLASTWGGIYRSTTGGSSWAKTSAFSSGWDVAIDPSNPSVCYAGASGVYKSTDGGATWFQLTNGLPSSSGRLVLAVSQSLPSTLYVLVSNTTFYRSTDAGGSWSSAAIPSDMFNGQGWYDIAVAVSPTNPQIVLIGGVDAYNSTNGGTTWTRITSGQHPDCHIFAFGPGVVYLGTDGGVNRSADNGSTFSRVNGNLAITQFYSVGTDELTPSYVWGGTQDNGTQKTTGPLAWSVKIGGDGGIVNVDRRNSGVVYAEGPNGYHYRTVNGGGSFFVANTGISGSGAWVTPVVLHPDTSAVLYTATSKIYRSADSAKSWAATAGSYPWGTAIVRQLAIPKTSPGTVYSSPGSTLYKSTDAGSTWVSVTTGLPGRTITSIVPHPTIPSLVYLTVSGTGTSHIFKSTDAGGSWASINGNFPADLPVNSIAAHPSDVNTLFIGTDLGMWSTADGGTTWLKDDGFPNTAVLMLGVTSDNSLVSATHGRSVFKAQLLSGPFIALTSPNGGESWITSTTHPITWTGSGISNVKLEYSADNAATWNLISASTPASSGTFSWVVPNTPASQALVRISDAANPATSDVSNAPFTIAPPASVTLTSPNGGESWNVLSTHNITWTSASVLNVKLEYSTDNGSGWTPIIASAAASTGSYAWTVPNSPTAQALVRISDAANAATSDVSNGVFSILAVPAVTVISPNGGEAWITGSVHNVSWSSTLISKVRLEYSTNTGGSWNGIADSTAAATGSYAWTLPNSPTLQALVRISDASNPGTFDVSNAVFTISLPPGITVGSPNGGEIWNVLSSHPITWVATNVANVRLEYSTNTGASWSLITSSTSASTGSYSWTIPNTPSSQALVRASDASNSAVRDSSDAPFSILAAPAVTVTAPNGGETWQSGSTQSITWISSSIANVKIEYSTDNGSSWSAVIASTPAAPAAYSWLIPATSTTHGRVRISDASNAAVNDISDAAFSITAPNGITVISPNGGEIWNVATAQTIRWTSAGTNNVRIKYSTNNGSTWITIVSNISASKGSYPWTIPNTPTTGARVQVGNASGSITDVSDAAFTISQGNAITVTAPKGGEVWYTGTTQNVTWSSSGVTNAKIEYSSDAGSSWNAVISSTPDAPKSYSWIVPNTPTIRAFVRVSDAGNPATSDVSDSVFTIAPPPSITLLAPDGGDLLVEGKTYNVRWQATSVDQIRLEYSTDNGLVWFVIEPITPANASAYVWAVPSTPTTQALVRVSDVQGLAQDQSQNSFEITALQFTSGLVGTNSKNQRDSLTFGAAHGATSGIDTVLDERELPPRSDLTILDLRWNIPGTAGTKIDILDTLTPSDSEETYAIDLQAGQDGLPVTLSWNLLGPGLWRIQDAGTHGAIFRSKMRPNATFTIVDPSVTGIEIVHRLGRKAITSLSGSWNLLSLPLDVTDNRLPALYPTAVSPAFGYEGGYHRSDTLSLGTGYWLKFAAAETTVILGDEVPAETLSVRAGWNLIGASSDTVEIGSLSSTPPGIVTSPFFGYSGSYAPASSLLPSAGYWVRTTQAGTIFRSGTGSYRSKGSVGASHDNFTGFDRLEFTDAVGRRETLYIVDGRGESDTSIARYELPPPPPLEAFDIRFATQRFVERAPVACNSGARERIVLQGIHFPLALHWNVPREGAHRLMLTDDRGGSLVGTHILGGDGTMRIVNDSISALLVVLDRRDGTPGAYRLDQNFPNPFNPSTLIRYSLSEASSVRLTVFDVLGREVVTLVNEKEDPGEYSARWGAPDKPSGLYVYKLVAVPLSGSVGTFVSTRKMLLIR